MASVDIVEDNGEKFFLMNVTERVGRFNSLNKGDDAQLVKALLVYALGSLGHPPARLPAPTTGTLDEQTKSNILIYQQKMNNLAKSQKKPARLQENGIVSHARGKYRWDTNRFWTIVALNIHVGEIGRALGFKGAAHLIIKTFPYMAGVLKIDPNQFD